MRRRGDEHREVKQNSTGERGTFKEKQVGTQEKQTKLRVQRRKLRQLDTTLRFMTYQQTSQTLSAINRFSA